VNGLLHGDSTRKHMNTMKMWSTSYQAGSCDWSLLSSFQNRNYYGMTDSFNRTVHFWNDSVLKLQVCLPIRIMMLSGNATKPENIDKVETKGFMKILFYFMWRVQPQRFLHTIK
jgi:hypothetical protein